MTDVIHQAIHLMWKNANKASPGAWTIRAVNDEYRFDKRIVSAAPHTVIADTRRENADHITMWNPETAIMVADLLNDIVTTHTKGYTDGGPHPVCVHCGDPWQCSEYRRAYAISLSALGEKHD